MKNIPPFKLVPEPQDEAASEVSGFKWVSKEIGTRHRLGGTPSFIQDSVWPDCPHGHGKMTFYGQLDSVGDDVCIADCGMVYVFICFDCYESISFVQSN